MKRNRGAKRGSRKKKRKVKSVLIAVSLLMLTTCGFIFTENTMKHTLSTTAELKSKEIIEQVVNSAVYDLTHTEDGSELEIIYTDEDQEGQLQMVTLNTPLLNKIGN